MCYRKQPYICFLFCYNCSNLTQSLDIPDSSRDKGQGLSLKVKHTHVCVHLHSTSINPQTFMLRTHIYRHMHTQGLNFMFGSWPSTVILRCWRLKAPSFAVLDLQNDALVYSICWSNKRCRHCSSWMSNGLKTDQSSNVDVDKWYRKLWKEIIAYNATLFSCKEAEKDTRKFLV